MPGDSLHCYSLRLSSKEVSSRVQILRLLSVQPGNSLYTTTGGTLYTTNVGNITLKISTWEALYTTNVGNGSQQGSQELNEEGTMQYNDAQIW